MHETPTAPSGDGLRVARVVGSAEFTVAFAWGLVFLSAAVPLLAVCVDHLVAGHLLSACAAGAVALPLAGVTLGRLSTGMHAAWRRYG